MASPADGLSAEPPTMPPDTSTPRSQLTWRTRLGYGLGHVLNDLCASMWFTYLLLFFHEVLEFDNVYAGVVLFVGQIADGLSTVFVGYFSDEGDDLWLCHKYGQRKSWHLVGTLCVVLSFPFIFLRCIECGDADQLPQLVYYAAFVVIFQFGWAATQISHLSMIPDLTSCPSERTGLTAIRYAATVAANIAVYLVAWAHLGIGDDGGHPLIGPEDDGSFRGIMIVCIVAGLACSGLFHLLVKPPTAEESILNNMDETNTPAPAMSVSDWLLEPQFYQVAGVYMATRLFVNLTQAYIPLYLQVTLRLHARFVAIIPLVMFVVGFVTSFVARRVNNFVGRKATFILSCLVGAAGCAWTKFGSSVEPGYMDYSIYGVAGLIGAGGSVMLITSLSLTADLIGRNVESSAFVYGAMSLTDKVSNGLAVILVQRAIPNDTDSCIDCRLFFRDVLFYVCGGAACLGVLSMLTLVPFRVGDRFRDRAGSYANLPEDNESVGRSGEQR